MKNYPKLFYENEKNPLHKNRLYLSIGYYGDRNCGNGSHNPLHRAGAIQFDWARLLALSPLVQVR